MEQKGVVLDAETRNPIEGASISLSKWQETTNELGEFKFEIVTGFCPDRKILIQKEGYKEFQIEVTSEDGQHKYFITTDYNYHEYPEPIPTEYNPKIKEQGSYFDLYSTRFEVTYPDSIIFLLDKKKHGM